MAWDLLYDYAGKVMESVMQDIRYGFRLILKDPLFALIVVLVLAVGIGANSAVFSVANALLLKPLPFQNLDRLVFVRENLADQSRKSSVASFADFNDWRTQNDVFQKMGAYRVRDVTLLASGEPETLQGSFVSYDFFSTLRVNPIHGRTFSSEEMDTGANPVAILGNGFWRRRFAGDSKIIGQTISLNDRVTTVIGIMPPHLDFPFGTEVWLPLALTQQQMNQRDLRNVYVFARLKDGVSIETAQSEMKTLAERYAQLYPNTNAGMGIQILPMRNLQADLTRPMMSILMTLAILLLIIGCANVANLMFAKSALRTKEIAIRAALSASRWRLIRQFLVEGCIFSMLGGTVGLLLAFWAVEIIRASLPPEIARFIAGWQQMNVDGRVLTFNIAISFITVLLFSLYPALQACKLNLSECFKEGSHSVTSGSKGRRIRNILVGSELALALVLLSSAGLMIKGFWRILQTYEGNHPERILTMQTQLPETKYPDLQKVAQFYEQVVERGSGLPQVDAMSVASNTPLNNSPNPVQELIIQGRPTLTPTEKRLAEVVVVSPGYFKMIGIPLLKGRDFTSSDNREGASVAIISDLAGRRYWPGEDPIGKKIKSGGSDEDDRPWMTVIGIVGDVKQSWFDGEVRPQLYLPYHQAPRFKMTFLLRTQSDPTKLIPAVRAQILEVDRNQPVTEIKTLARLYFDEGSPLRFAAVLMLVFGAIAFILSAVGVYGAMSFSVAQRKKEIGIRNALGAQRSDVLFLILRQAMQTTGLGLIIGGILSVMLGRILESALFGVVQLEYFVFLLLIAVLLIICFLSSYVPAYQASETDPVRVLRSE